MNKKALIIGISGQDGAWLSKLLLEKKYNVIGTTRNIKDIDKSKLKNLGIHREINFFELIPQSSDDVKKIIALNNPDEIYFLSGQSSVAESFVKPKESINSIVLAYLNILESIKDLNRDIKIYSAGSGECFGDSDKQIVNETSPFLPRSPYAVSKIAAHQLTEVYRKSYGIYACTGFLFNHESHLRPKHFVTQKIISSAIEIKQGSRNELKLGNIGISRDWGLASEYVVAMWLMLQKNQPDDFIIATGKTYSLENFIEETFNYLDLNWKDYVSYDTTLLRPYDIKSNYADPSKAKGVLNWEAKSEMGEVIKQMIDNYY